MIFRVIATDRVSKKGLAPIRDDERFEVLRIHDSSSREFEEALERAAGLIVRSATKVDAELMTRADGLKVIGRAGVGVDNIDVEAASAQGIAVFNAPAGNTIAAAELTMALMLSLVRRVTEADRSVRAGHWDRASFQGVELRGRTLGIVGGGRIGSAVAARCLAFGMEVLVYDPYLDPDRAEEMSVSLVDLSELISQSDVITLHVPLNDETGNLIDAMALEKMKKGAFLINASRGGVIVEKDLARALNEKKIAGAALDVYESEPLSGDSPLREARNLVLTPHLGASTKEAQVGVAHEVAIAVRGVLLDEDFEGALNAANLV